MLRTDENGCIVWVLRTLVKITTAFRVLTLAVIFFKDTEGPLRLQSCQCSLEVSGDVNDELDGTVYLFLNINYRPLTTIYYSHGNHLSGQRLKTGAWTKYRIYTNIFKRLYSGSKSHTGAKQATIDNILCNWFRFLEQDIINTGREYIKRKGRDS